MEKNFVLPKNATVLSNDQMIEVNGGKKYTVTLSNEDCKGLCFAICGTLVGLSASAIVATIDVMAMSIAAFVPGMAGLTTALVGKTAWDFAKVMLEVCTSETKGLRIDYEYPLDIDFTIINKRR